MDFQIFEGGLAVRSKDLRLLVFADVNVEAQDPRTVVDIADAAERVGVGLRAVVGQPARRAFRA